MELLIAAGIGLMMAVGVYQVLRRNLIRSAIGLIIISNAIHLLLIYAGAYRGVVAPYAFEWAAEGRSDALPQVLVLTAIVIAMGGFSLVLGMIYIFGVRYRTGDMDKVDQLKY